MKHPMQCAKCFRVCRLSDSGKTWVCTICKHREKAEVGQAVSDEQITAEATPAGELRRQILSQCVAKNEREWWAARTIEKLEFELNAANDRIKRLEEALSFVTVDCGNLHHGKKHRHKYGEPCPVVELIEKAKEAKP